MQLYIQMEMGSGELRNLLNLANTCMHKSWCTACIVSVHIVEARGEISRTPANARGKSPLCVPLVCRVLSRIYLLGKKSQVAEGYKLPSRGLRVPPREIF